MAPAEALRCAIVAGWDVADALVYEDDLTIQDRIQLAASNEPALAEVIPFPKTKNATGF